MVREISGPQITKGPAVHCNAPTCALSLGFGSTHISSKLPFLYYRVIVACQGPGVVCTSAESMVNVSLL